MGDKELVIKADELNILSIRCACGSAIEFNAKKDRATGDPQCPACGNTLVGSAVLMNAYRAFYRDIANKENITLRLKLRDSQ